jgi:hypothetical protein
VKNMLKKKPGVSTSRIELGSFQTCLILNPQHMTPLLVAPSWLDNETSLFAIFLCSVGLYFQLYISHNFCYCFLSHYHHHFFQLDYSTITGYLLLCLTLDFIVVVISFSFRLPTQPKRFYIWTQISLVGTMGKCNTIA